MTTEVKPAPCLAGAERVISLKMELPGCMPPLIQEMLENSEGPDGQSSSSQTSTGGGSSPSIKASPTKDTTPVDSPEPLDPEGATANEELSEEPADPSVSLWHLFEQKRRAGEELTPLNSSAQTPSYSK